MPTTDSKETEVKGEDTRKKGAPILASGFTFAKEVVRRHWPALIALGLMLLLYSQTLAYWYRQWMKDDSYYSHGPLVVPIAIFMVWSIRSKLMRVEAKPSLWGLAVIIPLLPVYMVGRVSGAVTLTSASFLVTLIGCILLIYGTRVTRLLLFPTLFLVSMLPLPSIMLDEITGPVQQMSTTGAAVVLKLLYPETIRQAMNIEMPGWIFVVGVPCSGFKLLVSLLTFTAFFAYMLEGELWRKVGLFLFAAPFAIAINVLRVVMIGLAGEWFGEEAGHAFHDYSGYIVLIVAFLLLFKMAKFFGCKDFGEAAFAPTPGGLFTGVARSSVTWRNSFVLIGIFALILGANQAFPEWERSAKAQIERSEYPMEFGQWAAHGPDHEIDEATQQELKTADILSRNYQNRQGYFVSFMNVAGVDNDAFHSPRSCLPGGGWDLSGMKVLRIPVEGSKEETIAASSSVMVYQSDVTERMLVLYWYQTGAKTIPSTGKSRLEKLTRRLIAGMKRTEQESENTYFYRLITPALDGEDAAQERLVNFAKEFTLARQDYID